MKFLKQLKIICAFIFLFQLNNYAQNNFKYITHVDTLLINYENSYKVSGLTVIPSTETIYLDNKILNKNEYSFSYSKGIFSLSDSLHYSDYDTLIVEYKSLRLALHKEYKKRTLIRKLDKTKSDSVSYVVKESTPLTEESIFGRNMQKSGTIVRGFTFGTTKDFSLNSGLRLQLSGRLSNDIEVVAALTDKNTPIQPEGNTARLEELDKVFILIKHPNAQGTFGDYFIKRKIGEFGSIDRKLQGIKGEFNYKTSAGFVSFATSKGKFNTNYFNGQDGVQGPYRLTGINSKRDIIIIAGTEKVYVDGIRQKRGEHNDYVIEYGNAQITFTPNKLITAASRINVDFEYTDRRYSRNFFGAGGVTKLLNNKLELNFQYIREGDNQNAPIDILLTDADKSILKNAGDDINKATKSGISLAPKDSNGIRQGRYEKVDTLINNNPFSIYRYNPGNPNSIYNVAFSFKGSGKGDYLRESLGVFNFVGIGKGAYLPIIFLPMPQLNQVGNFIINYKPIDGIDLSFEYSGSIFDRNRFSALDDNNNFGSARNIHLNISPQKIILGNLNLGEIGLTYKDRFVSKRYSPIDRINTIEFNRNYNLNTSLTNLDQNLRELNLTYLPLKNLVINSFFGFLRQGTLFKSNRYKNTVRYNNGKAISAFYNIDYVKTENTNFKSKWTRQEGESKFNVFGLTSGLNYLAENKEEFNLNSDSLLDGSLKYYEFDPYISYEKIKGLKLSFKYTFRKEYAAISGVLLQQANAKGQFYEIDYSGNRTINTHLTVVLRNKIFEKDFTLRGFKESKTVLIRSVSNVRLLKNALSGNVFYEVSTQKSAKLQQIFVKVEKGKGNFIYIGDLNKNGIQDENEFEPALFDGNYIKITTPTDKLFPVISLKMSTNWRIRFSEFINKNSIIGKILKPISTETFWRVEEKSREEDLKKIYLLNFSSFQNVKNTIRGSNFIQQDIFINENSYVFSFRFRFTQSKNLNLFSDGPVRSYIRERSIRFRMRLVKEISNQTEFVNKQDNAFLDSNIPSTRRRQITSNSISSDFVYRPENNIEVGFKLKAGRSTDVHPTVPTVIDFNSQSIRMVLSFASRGRFRVNFRRDELLGNTAGNFLPFEITGGKLIGKNYFWDVSFEYRIATNLQTSLSYIGRLRAGDKAVHTARAEFRAFF